MKEYTHKSSSSHTSSSHKSVASNISGTHSRSASHRTDSYRRSSHKGSASHMNHCNKKRRTRSTASFILKGSFILLCCFILSMFALRIYNNIHSTPSVVHAEENLSPIHYRTVEIQYGDSLWSIAEDNMTSGFTDINEYIDEIRECNQLSSDHITEGNYLIIPYYEVG